MADEVTEKDFKKEKKEKSLAYKITNVVLWIVLFAWMGICLFDFLRVHQEKDSVFCIKEETMQYYDGTVDSCLGLGYKVYHYNRESFKGIEFGPFWGKDKSENIDEE